MGTSRDRRSVGEQAKSGLRIAAALLATLATIALVAFAYLQITEVEGSHHVLAGWILMAALVVILSTTVQFWRKWFYFLPGFVAIRSGLWALLRLFTPHGYIPIGFLILTAIMSVLSYRFNKLTRILVSDRIVLLSALACFLGSVPAALAAPPKISVLDFAGGGGLDPVASMGSDPEASRQNEAKGTS